jgi:hypothetical protein
VIPWRIPLVLGSARVGLAKRCRHAVGSTGVVPTSQRAGAHIRDRPGERLGRHSHPTGRADVAHLMLGLLEQPETIKEVMGIAY